jgi:hypothetical protein
VQLAVLVQPCPNSPVGFISPDLSQDPTTKSGYIVALAAGAGSQPGQTDCNGTPTETAFHSTAIPASVGLSGGRAFAATANGTIFFLSGGTAPTEAQMVPGGGALPIQ